MNIEDLLCAEIQSRLEEKVKGEVYCWINTDYPLFVFVRIKNKDYNVGYKNFINASEIYSGYKSIEDSINDLINDYKKFSLFLVS